MTIYNSLSATVADIVPADQQGIAMKVLVFEIPNRDGGCYTLAKNLEFSNVIVTNETS